MREMEIWSVVELERNFAREKFASGWGGTGRMWRRGEEGSFKEVERGA